MRQSRATLSQDHLLRRNTFFPEVYSKGQLSRSHTKVVRARTILILRNLHTLNNSLVACCVFILSALNVGCGYWLSQVEGFPVKQPEQGVSVNGKVLGTLVTQDAERRSRLTVLLRTPQGKEVNVTAIAGLVWCRVFGIEDTFFRIKKNDEIEAFGKMINPGEISVCGSGDHYLKIAKREDTKNWKDYRNEKFGFEVRHPSKWEIREESGSVSFTDPAWGEAPKISGPSVIVQIFKAIPLDKAIREAGFLTRKEALQSGDLQSGEEGKYFIPASAAGPAAEVVETSINGIPALVAEVPVRLYGEKNDTYIGAGEGRVVFLIGDRLYASIDALGPVQDFDSFVLSFKFLGSAKRNR